MTVRRRVFGWPGWTAALCLIAAPAPALAPGVEGYWRLIGNPYRSQIGIWIAANGLSADIGCTHVGMDFERRGADVTTGDGLVFEAPCRDDERYDRAVNDYWDRIERRIEGVRKLELKGKRLVLTSADGRRLVFVRAKP